jgi:hypothetical protein
MFAHFPAMIPKSHSASSPLAPELFASTSTMSQPSTQGKESSSQFRSALPATSFPDSKCQAFERSSPLHELNSCRRNQRPGVRRALSLGLGGSAKSSYSHWHSPTGRRLRPLKEQREQMQQGCQIKVLAVTAIEAFAHKPNESFNADANIGHRFAILMANVGALRPYRASGAG